MSAKCTLLSADGVEKFSRNFSGDDVMARRRTAGSFFSSNIYHEGARCISFEINGLYISLWIGKSCRSLESSEASASLDVSHANEPGRVSVTRVIMRSRSRSFCVALRLSLIFPTRSIGCDTALDIGISMLRTHCWLLSNPSITLDFIPPFLPRATKDPRDTFTYANAF